MWIVSGSEVSTSSWCCWVEEKCPRLCIVADAGSQGGLSPLGATHYAFERADEENSNGAERRAWAVGMMA